MALRFKILPVILLLTSACFGQAFLKPIPRPKPFFSVMADSAIVVTTRNQFRPIINVSSYAIPINALLTGTGVSYQHLKWNGTKWIVKWSASALVWYKAGLNGMGNAIAVGGTVGLLNNLVLIGFGNSSGQWFGTFGPGVNLNN